MQKHVLVVSEKDQVTKRYSKFFKTYGCAVRFARSASEAIASIGEGAPDLILCDDQLDVISAGELIEIFKRHRRTAFIPVLLIKEGSVSMQALESLDLRVRVDGIVPFPCTDEVLADVVNKWLAGEKRQPPADDCLRNPLEPASTSRPLPTWRHGDIDVLSLSRLLYRLCSERETGVLNLATGQRRMHVAIEDGQLIGVNSNYLRDDTLGRFLVEQGRLTPQDMDRAFRRSRDAGVSYGRTLVEMNLLTAAEREAFVAAHMRQKLSRAFTVGWSGGHYDFSRQRADGEIPRMPPEPLGRLLRHSLLTVAPLGEINEAFAQTQKTEQPISLMPECEPLTQVFCLDPAAQRLCQWIHGKSFDDIRRLASPQTELLLRLAFLLIVSRAARFADGPIPPLAPPVSREEVPAAPASAAPVGEASRFAAADVYRRALTDGRTYFNRDEQALAVPHFLKALEINADSSEALAFLAMAKFNLGGKRDIAVAVEAKEQLKRAIAVDDHNDNAHLFLGRIFKHEGKTMLAETYFKKAHALNPLNDEARREVTLIRIKRRQQRDLGLK